jgi:hypothetical protein
VGRVLREPSRQKEGYMVLTNSEERLGLPRLGRSASLGPDTFVKQYTGSIGRAKK